MYRAAGPVELRPVGEVEFANGVAAMAASGTYGKTRVCAGIVGHADLALGAAVEKVLEAMIEAGGGRFRGIRFITASHPDQPAWGSPIIRPAGLLMDPKVREGFARLAPLGLSFDAWMYHTQLDELIDLARAFPATQIVLDHVGGPIGLGPYAGKRDEVFAAWRGMIRELASCPNVHIKLGGLGMRRVQPSSGRIAAELGGAGRGVAALYRDLHRRLWPRARDVREQLSGRQGQLRLPRDVERVQAHRRWLLPHREGRTFRRYGEQVLPVGINALFNAIGQQWRKYLSSCF